MSGVRIAKKDTAIMDRIIRETPERMERAGAAMAQEMLNDIVLSFGTSPSSPGDPPGVDTNTLRPSMRWKPDGRLRWVIHDQVEYGVFLEFGTERMAARPFISPVFEAWRAGKWREFMREFGILP